MTRVLEELKHVRGVIIRFTLVFLVFFAGLLILTPREIGMSGYRLTVPLPGTPSIATQLFLSAKNSLVPAGVPVVALGPVAPFIAPITMAFLVALLLAFPFGLYFVVSFLWPALRPREQKIVASILIPSLILFYAGCALAYFLIIPLTFSILYSFADPVGVLSFFALDTFISSVFFLTISVGIAFLLPVFMAMATRIGLFPRDFWLRHFRGAVASIVIFSAVVTPDGSGVTMALLSVPLIVLYIFGSFVAKR